MKNDQNLVQNDQNSQNQQENTQIQAQNAKSTQKSTTSTPPDSKITLSVPNPRIYLSKALSNTKNYYKTTNFFQKTLKFKIFFVFLLVLTVINVVMTVKNVEVKQTNKKLNEDMISIYEAFEVTNMARKITAREIKYLESLIEENNIYLSPMYRSDISDEVYEEYKETIDQFHKIDYNAVLDQFLHEDYNMQLYERRVQEERAKEKYENSK